MAFDVTFLIALTCLLIGVGCFKGNLASQVGALYATGDNRRADAFQIYYIFINAGVIISPLIAGTLGEVYGWHYGFGAAGIGMLIGLAIYLSGRKWLPPDSPLLKAEVRRTAKPRLTHREKMAIIALLLLLPVLTIAIIGNQQIFNAYLVWAEGNANLIFFGKKMPTTWLVTLDSIVSVSFLAGTVVFWRLWSKKFPEPPEITKIGIGSLVAVTGFISLAMGAAIAASSGTKVSIGWLITFHVLNSIGFANIFPVSLALYARVAPAALSATIIGIYYLAFFAANNLVGIDWRSSRKNASHTILAFAFRTYADQPASSSSSPAISSATCWRLVTSKARRDYRSDDRRVRAADRGRSTQPVATTNPKGCGKRAARMARHCVSRPRTRSRDAIRRCPCHEAGDDYMIKR